MGNNLAALVHMNDDEYNETMDRFINDLGFSRMYTPEQIATIKTQAREQLLQMSGGDFTAFFNGLARLGQEIGKCVETNPEIGVPKTYEGSCGFTLDPKGTVPEEPASDSSDSSDISDLTKQLFAGQRLLDKYMPRDLNSHAREITNIYANPQVTWQMLSTCEDPYPFQAMMTAPLCFIFFAFDKKFQEFRDEAGREGLRKFFRNDHPDMTNEVIDYLFSVTVAVDSFSAER